MRGKAHTSTLRGSSPFLSSLSPLYLHPSIPPHPSSPTSVKAVNERKQLEVKAALVLTWESYGSEEQRGQGRNKVKYKADLFCLN